MGCPLKYFKQNGDKWILDEKIRKMVNYKEFNLMDNPSAFGRFDIIFCRNVLIYFEQDTKAKVLERMASMMPPDGVLYLGGAETVLGITNAFEPVPNERGMYKVVLSQPAKHPASSSAKSLSPAMTAGKLASPI